MKRLLCIVGSMNAGGAETFLMKLYRQLDKRKYQMDFAVAVSERGYYDEEILSLGGKIHHITPKSSGLLKNFSSIVNLVRREQYRYVLRVSQHSLSALELLAAKIGGAKVRAFRSSNSNTTTGTRKDLMIHKLFSIFPRCFANVKLAPSTEAASFMFGKNCIKEEKVSLLHNAIDLDNYTYCNNARLKIREELHISDQIVVGHIGRFNQQKNHSFLIDIFLKLHRKNKNSVLLLVGVGELEGIIKKKIDELGLNNSVIFTGLRSDIPDLLSAMDVFVFPSFYEGMPNTVIEAQATGLPCVISDTITREADITGLVKYMSLESSGEEWADAAIRQMQIGRQDTRQAFVDAGYDIHDVVNQFVSLVFQEKGM